MDASCDDVRFERKRPLGEGDQILITRHPHRVRLEETTARYQEPAV
jgi:hypothetical protein